MSDTTPAKPGKTVIGATFYTDGSAKPRNPGTIGYSVHGYTYTDAVATKGAGHPKVVPTAAGYLDKTTPDATCVDLVNYYDYLGWMPGLTTNNEAEVRGVAQALKYACTFPQLKYVSVYSDSKYAVDGLNNFAPNWVANGWIKRNGDPVPHQELWKELLASVDTLRANKTKINVSWIKGHADNFGNIRADQLASIAGELSVTATEFAEKETVSEATGYWKNDNEKHPMLALRGWFFTVNKDHVVPGEYFLCNQVKSDEFIGRRAVDGAYGYVLTVNPDPLLELVRTRQIEEAREFDTLALARIDRIYDKAVCAALDSYGPIVLRRRRKNSNDLHFINEDAMVKPAKGDSGADKTMPITEELWPPKLALRCVETISCLKNVVNAFKDGSVPQNTDTTKIFDITEHYFQPEKGKKGEEVLMFRKDIGVAYQSVSMQRELFGRTMQFQQIFGIHVMLRNNLKRLEGTDVKVWLVVDKVSPRAVRYSTVIKSDKDYSAWCGAHSNLIVFAEDLQ